MTPVAAPPHVFSLDAERLAYGRFRVKAGASTFEAYQSVDLPGEAFFPGILGGPLRDEAGFGELLSGLLSQVEAPISEASLVLPDAWLRLAFTEVGELPTDPQDLDAVLRWKLKRLVPFRVDELRLRGTEVSPLENQEEPNRALLGFALETLLAQQERLFQAAGIRLGRVANLSLCLLASLSTEVVDRPLLGLVVVEPAGYTLLFARRGEPILHRFKSADPELPFELRQQRAIHDLRLTRSFLAERFPGTTLDLNLLVKSPLVDDPWQEWIESGLESRTEALSETHLPALSVQISKQEADAAQSFLEIAPMLGASRQVVA